jgi:hypothetical protein
MMRRDPRQLELFPVKQEHANRAAAVKHEYRARRGEFMLTNEPGRSLRLAQLRKWYERELRLLCEELAC